MSASAKSFGRWVDQRADALRRLQRLGPIAPLDPYALAGAMGVPVVSPSDAVSLGPAFLAHLLGAGARSWSAGTLCLPDGRFVVVMNPTHAETRRRATLMEELAHLHLQHKPSELFPVDGKIFRSYLRSQERQAYSVGATALVPLAALQHARRMNQGAATIAKQYGVSQSLVTFRENVTGVRLTATELCTSKNGS